MYWTSLLDVWMRSSSDVIGGAFWGALCVYCVSNWSKSNSIDVLSRQWMANPDQLRQKPVGASLLAIWRTGRQNIR